MKFDIKKKNLFNYFWFRFITDFLINFSRIMSFKLDKQRNQKLSNDLYPLLIQNNAHTAPTLCYCVKTTCCYV